MPDGMTLGTECVLRAESADKATARFTNQNLDCSEVRQNVLVGKAPLALELCWGEHLSLVLTAGGRFKKIRLANHSKSTSQPSVVEALDAEFTLFAAELSAAIFQLRTEIGATSHRLAEAAGESARAIKGIASMWQARPAQGRAQPIEA